MADRVNGAPRGPCSAPHGGVRPPGTGGASRRQGSRGRAPGRIGREPRRPYSTPQGGVWPPGTSGTLWRRPCRPAGTQGAPAIPDIGALAPGEAPGATAGGRQIAPAGPRAGATPPPMGGMLPPGAGGTPQRKTGSAMGRRSRGRARNGDFASARGCGRPPRPRRSTTPGRRPAGVSEPLEGQLTPSSPGTTRCGTRRATRSLAPAPADSRHTATRVAWASS